MRAVGYVRVSSEEQASGGVSLAAQQAKIKGYADLYGLDLVAVEVQAGASAESLDRPALGHALAAIDRGDADGLLIAKLDRLSRSVADWDRLIAGYFGEKAGRKLRSVADAIDTTTAAGRLVLNVLMSVAQWEREAIAERTRDALRHKIRTGSRCGKVRFGSALDPDDPRRSRKTGRPVGLVTIPAEAESPGSGALTRPPFRARRPAPRRRSRSPIVSREEGQPSGRDGLEAIAPALTPVGTTGGRPRIGAIRWESRPESYGRRCGGVARGSRPMRPMLAKAGPRGTDDRVRAT